MEDTITTALRKIIREEIDAALLPHLGKPAVPKNEEPELTNSRGFQLREELRLLNNFHDLVLADDAATYLGVSRRKLDEMRSHGTGPSVYMFFTRVCYRKDVLENYKRRRDNGVAKGVPDDFVLRRDIPIKDQRRA